ncbi:MAG: MGH1-like glycoside hydrolase domain-containing protein [Candidatus Acidiferrales bacterium]
MTREEQRVVESQQRKSHWKRWGPYLSERQWGTVREDYSADGDAWEYFPHDHARSRVYRWGEDGIAGICDRHQRVCFALGLWNERDAILKERLFGLTNSEGNHGEDVKEYYFYLDATPTSSYLKCLYKYPHAAFPYEQLLTENHQRTRKDPEFELMDTGIFNENRYFDVYVEYAKASAEDILIRISAVNRGPETAPLHLLPTLWFRNTWAWGNTVRQANVKRISSPAGTAIIEAHQSDYGNRWLIVEGSPELLFTENETNTERLYNVKNKTPYVKDGIHNCIVYGKKDVVNPAQTGTKVAAHYSLQVKPGASISIRLRLTDQSPIPQSGKSKSTEGESFGQAFETTFAERIKEADEFYAERVCKGMSDDARTTQRQAFAGILWGKQSYHYEVQRWLSGDPTQPPPPPERLTGRNHQWVHIYNADVISMPDKWEYPWYASWDLAFHCVAMAPIDPDFAKEQLILLLREWYMHPNGQIPAYEWNFSNANPPVHAWAAWRVYKIEGRVRGKTDRTFLERVFQKLLLNFTWWVNRKDPLGMNVFEGGFLGLDNIGIFDRSMPLPGGGYVDQSDGTSWMAMFCLNMMSMAMELAHDDPAYEDLASKFFEHFVYIADAMNNIGTENVGLWHEDDGFYYDVCHLSNGAQIPIQVRSMVGLIPLFAVETFEPEDLERLPDFQRRMNWFMLHHPGVPEHIDMSQRTAKGARLFFSITNKKKMLRVLRFMLDENEFLSPYGIRSLSKYHQKHPFILTLDGKEHRVDYEPAESTTALFGGNSNWRGPVWFPLNFLLIEALQRYHHYYGDQLKVECPYGSGQQATLWDIAAEISQRLVQIFLRGQDGRRPVYGATTLFQEDPYWRDLILFYEYFNGDNGAGLGASHQTGWTALVSKLIEQSGDKD